MKYPRAYVFFKSTSVINRDEIQATIGEDIDSYYPTTVSRSNQSIEQHSKVAYSVLTCTDKKMLKSSHYVVFNASELNSFFIMKYREHIEGIIWMKTAEDFKKLRKKLTVFKYFWKMRKGLNLAVSNYGHVDKILGNDCPELPRNMTLFSNLSSYYSSLDLDVIFPALHNHLHSIANTDQYKI
jgi:hypothetical protein